jgi:dTDP-4-amino-4,6-dideoxygalactose transaminase
MIPFAKPFLTKDDAQSVFDTVLSGWVTQGPRVAEFERKFADFVGAKYAVAASSCTSALHLSMIVAGIKPGDEVICPSLSFIATANAIRYVGACPIFAEVDPNTYNIDPEYAERIITPRTKAIVIVHQLGMPSDIDRFSPLCEKYGLKLVEDAACAAGSVYKGRRIGCHSELVCFSFHPRKVITTGDGGMITTSKEEFYIRLKRLRHHGMSISDPERHLSRRIILEDYLELGYNFRMTDIQAALGIKQLEKLDWLVAERRKTADKYNRAFQDLPYVRLPFEKEGYYSNFQSYGVYLSHQARLSRNDLMQKLLDQGISTRRGVMAIHREKPYADIGGRTHLPITEDISDHSILLPLYVPMSDEEVETVIEKFRNLLAT